MEQQGSKLLKVTSILMIIGGIVGAVFSVLMAVISAGATALINTSELQQAISDTGASNGVVVAVLWIGVAVMVISAIVEIIAGVKGKNNWANPAMAKSLLVWGIVVAVLSLLGNILFMTSNAGSSIVSILTGLVIPVLYIIGAVQLKKQA